MRKRNDLIYALVFIALSFMVALAFLALLGSVARSASEEAEIHKIMRAAQERIDAYVASEHKQFFGAAFQIERVPIKEALEELENSEESPDEDSLIEAALVNQGYFRDDVPLIYDLQDVLHTASNEFCVRYELALAVIEVETNFTNVFGDGGDSIGYFQIQPRWWGDLMEEIGVDDLTDPIQNFRTGCAILARLIDRYGNERDALTAYNSGKPGESRYADTVLAAVEEWEN